MEESPAPNGPLPRVNTVEPAQEGRREAVVYYDAEPQFMLAYHKPVYPVKDDMHFMVLHSLLSDGRSSILQRELVQQKRIATSIYSSEAPGELYPSLFYVAGTPSRGVSNETLVKEVEKILARIGTEAVAEEDLEAAKRRIKVDLINLLSSNYGLARALAHAELLWGDWRELFDMYDISFATTAEDIQALSRKYFQVNNSTLVRLEKKASENIGRE